MLQVSALFNHIYIVVNSSFWGSSLIYNTSARHVRHECDTSDTNTTPVWHKWDTSATRMTQVRHEWKILILITTLVKTYFHTLIFTIWHVKDCKEGNNFILGTLLEIPRFHVKMRLKSAPQKINFLMAKAISKRCTLDCSYKYPCTLLFSHKKHFMWK